MISGGTLRDVAACPAYFFKDFRTVKFTDEELPSRTTVVHSFPSSLLINCFIVK